LFSILSFKIPICHHNRKYSPQLAEIIWDELIGSDQQSFAGSLSGGKPAVIEAASKQEVT
jgi:hypothetical protein